MKKEVAYIMLETSIFLLSLNTLELGTMDKFLILFKTCRHYDGNFTKKLKPTIEKHINLKLNEILYARVYKGDVLKRHIDRFSCEISTTLNLGGNPWPIYLEPSGKKYKGIK